MTGEGLADPADKSGLNALAGMCSGGLPDTGKSTPHIGQ
jgi:hypothetical protein